MNYSTANPDRVTTEERYAGATNARNLTLPPDGGSRTDADILLAAGYASAGNTRASLALLFYRLRATGNMAGFREVVNIAGDWLHGRSLRRGRRRMSRLQGQDLAARVIYWWLNPACKPCAGRGHPLMPDSPVINHGHNCGVCHGTGKYPIHRIVPPGTSDEARWLVDEIDQHCGLVFNDMARLLSRQMNGLEL